MASKQDKPRWLENHQPMTYGYNILMALTLPLALFLFVPITLVFGAASILTSTLWTIKAWWKRLRS